MAARPKAAGGVWTSLKGYLEHHRDSVKWLLGISTATGCAVVVGQQVLDPHSAAQRAATTLKAGVQEAGVAASSWAKSALQRAATPQQRVLGSAGHQQAAPQPGSIQGYAARWLADWCAQPERSHLAVALGGGPLLDWLIETATVVDDQTNGATAADVAERQQAERALTFLLQQDATATLLVERPGAVPRLLRHCLDKLQPAAASSFTTRQDGLERDRSASAAQAGLAQLYDALQRRAFAGLVVVPESSTVSVEAGVLPDEQVEPEPELSIARMVHNILGGPTGSSSAGSAWGRGEAYLSDLQEVMEMLLYGDVVSHPSSNSSQSATASQLPTAAGPSTEQQQQTHAPRAGSSPALASAVGMLASEAEPLTTHHQLQLQAVAAGWLASWAEAHASNSDKLTELNVSAAIQQVASRVSGRTGCDESRALQLQLVRLISALALPGSSSEALLYRTSQSIFSSTEAPYPASRVTRQAASHAAPHHLAACLQPLLYITADAAVEKDGARAVTALSALRQVLLHGGQPVAAAASMEPVMPLLDKLVQETKEVEVQQAAVHVVAALAQHPASLGEPSVANLHISHWRDWLLAKLCADGQDPEQERLKAACSAALAELAALPGLAGLQVTHYWLAALLATLATRVWPYNAVVYTGPQDVVMGPPIPPPPSAAQPSGIRRYFTRRPKDKSTEGAASTGKVAAGGDGGTGVNGTATQAVDARDLVDAVPVLPSHIAAVASALEAASAAVVEEHEPPPDFDPGAAGAAAPLARAFYKQAAHAVDMMVAEQRVCQALEVLNALVAADPAKQRWLLSVGVLPLLHRLIHPPTGMAVDPGAVLQHLTNIPEPSKAISAAATAAAAAAKDGNEGRDRVAGEGIKEGAGEALLTAPSTPTVAATTPAPSAKSPGLATRLYNSLPALPWRKTSSSTTGTEVKGSSTQQQQQQVEAAASGQAAVARPSAGQPTPPELQDVVTDHEGPSHLCLKRQVARLLALLVIQPGARQAVGSPHWQPWLHQAAQDADCRLASHATKALLNLEAFRQRDGDYTRRHLTHLQDWRTRITGITTSRHHPGMPLPLPSQPSISIATASRSTPAPAPVYQDMVHLLNPGAQHLWTLARSGSRPHSSQLLERSQPSVGVVPQPGLDAAIADAASAAHMVGLAGSTSGAGTGSTGTRSTIRASTGSTETWPAGVAKLQGIQSAHAAANEPADAACSVHVLTARESADEQANQQQPSSNLALTTPATAAAAFRSTVSAGQGDLLSATRQQVGQSIDMFQHHLLTAAYYVANVGTALLPTFATMQGAAPLEGLMVGATGDVGSSGRQASLSWLSHAYSSHPHSTPEPAVFESATLPTSAATSSPTTSTSHGPTLSPILASVAEVPSASKDGSASAAQDSTSVVPAGSSSPAALSGKADSLWKRMSWWSGRPAPPSEEVVGALIPPGSPQPTTQAGEHPDANQPPNSTGEVGKIEGSVGHNSTDWASVYGGTLQAARDTATEVALASAVPYHKDAAHGETGNGTAAPNTTSEQQQDAGAKPAEDKTELQQLINGGTLLEPLSDPRLCDGAAAPLVDVVFVHGIRGGPFITWRKPGSTAKSKAGGRGPAAYLTRSHCWPSDWLPQDVPCARLLTVEYLAPVSGWEGESLPLEATVQRVMAQLEAAGVGQRPVVFVAHSMGGLLIKEVLARSLQVDNKQWADQHVAGDGMTRSPSTPCLASAARGVVFFATPHFGSELAAMGWKLRHMPYASPAPALARLTPGPHLSELNDALQQLHDSGGLRVVSVVEGQATQLAPVLPKLHIVPQASAYPGFGELVLLPADDHISLCKPPSRQAEAYKVVLGMVQQVLAEELGLGSGDLLHPSQP